jgi:hypothetical protein
MVGGQEAGVQNLTSDLTQVHRRTLAERSTTLEQVLERHVT